MKTIESDVMSVPLTDDLLDEVIEVLGKFVLNEEPCDEFVEELLKNEDNFVAQIEEKTLYEPSVREKLMTLTSQFLISKPWLKYEDGWTDEVYDEFLEDLQVAYDKWYDRNIK